jgi:hypothetical protein
MLRLAGAVVSAALALELGVARQLVSATTAAALIRGVSFTT